jgi:hypothetical protein
MVQTPRSAAQRTPHQTPCIPLSILRTETVLSRFPIHNLTKRGDVTIHITKTNAQGELELSWAVSYNNYYGPPGPLAYKLDTIVINQLLDGLPRPLPDVLRVGSLRQIGILLDVNDSGRQQAHLKNAFHQNASAYIVAKLRYYGRDGTERRLEAGFTRYSVIFAGECLPDSTTADAVYLVLSDPYREVLTHAPVRPLDYDYLRALTPMAQRFYELLSYKVFAALKHRLRYATLRYRDYCLLATQHRQENTVQMQKQMYKVYQPHVQSGYLTKVVYEATIDDTGQLDWLMHYTPGPKAQTEYAAFMRQPGADAAAARALAADQDDLVATVTQVLPRPTPRTRREATVISATAVAGADHDTHAPASTSAPPSTPHSVFPPAETAAPATSPADPLHAQAESLVRQFYQRFYGLANVTPGPKELAQALELLGQHGAATAHFFVDFSHQAARATQYEPQTFMGIWHYLDRALAAYEARATLATTRQTAAAERTQREQHLTWEHHQLAQLRAARPPEELAALEAEARARLVAEGTPAVALPLAVRVAVDQVLAAQAGLPSFELWRQRQEAGG